ncbi:hypothetical protein MBLNU230_g6392t1 [Neophaeotheca triangularis]
MPAAAAQADSRVKQPTFHLPSTPTRTASPFPLSSQAPIDIQPTKQRPIESSSSGSSRRARPGHNQAASTRPLSEGRSTPPCTAACCSPLAKAAPQASSEPTSLNRPVLKRGTTTPSNTPSNTPSTTHTTHDRASATGTDGALLQSEDGSTTGFPDFGDLVDGNTFEQILEMDDDEDEREFSKSIVYDFFAQADSTFEKMDDNLEKQDLAQLSALGHFLKGSSATLGLTKVKDSCEKIQHFGAQKDVTGTHDEPDKDKCLKNCKETVAQAKQEFKEVEVLLRRFYRDEGGAADSGTAAAAAATAEK